MKLNLEIEKKTIRNGKTANLFSRNEISSTLPPLAFLTFKGA